MNEQGVGSGDEGFIVHYFIILILKFNSFANRLEIIIDFFNQGTVLHASYANLKSFTQSVAQGALSL